MERLEQVTRASQTHGDGPFTAAATGALRRVTGANAALLTTSCTHALELAGRLLDLGPGDEVVLPTYTFPSAATAVTGYGATPVFVDVDPATGNPDIVQMVAAMGPATKAVSVLHYAGIPLAMEPLLTAARIRGITVIEDNAHGLGVQTPCGTLGTLGDLGTQSFHDTKNVQCGEGGALLINRPDLVERAEILREKGTNRANFLRGKVDRYSWVDQGSSYLPSEYTAAVLDAQLAAFDHIQAERMRIWQRYATELADWADRTNVTLMDPPGGIHAAHIFYLLLPEVGDRDSFEAHLAAQDIDAAGHYVPLHSSAAGRRFGRTPWPLHHSETFARRLVRLPLWAGLPETSVDRVIEAVTTWNGC